MRAVPGGSELLIRAKPRSSRSEVLGVRSTPSAGEVLEVRLTAPPVDGAANAELLSTLSQALGIPQRDLRLAQGAAGRTKRVRITGLAPAEVRTRLRLQAEPAGGR
ncbi:MAG: DUF167 domain-containing protein [Myxococcaceae bacterium]